MSRGESTAKPKPKPRPRVNPACAPLTGSPPARRQAAVILEVLAGVRRPTDAAQALGVSLVRYYQLERRALLGLLSACEPAPRGPRSDLSRRVTALERENRRLQRDCARQQALVRAAERTLGLAAPAAAKPAGKAAPTPNGAAAPASGKRRRSRRPTVRALRAVRQLQRETAATPETLAPADVAPTGEKSVSTTA